MYTGKKKKRRDQGGGGSYRLAACQVLFASFLCGFVARGETPSCTSPTGFSNPINTNTQTNFAIVKDASAAATL